MAQVGSLNVSIVFDSKHRFRASAGRFDYTVIGYKSWKFFSDPFTTNTSSYIWLKRKECGLVSNLGPFATQLHALRDCPLPLENCVFI